MADGYYCMTYLFILYIDPNSFYLQVLYKFMTVLILSMQGCILKVYRTVL